MAIKYSVLMACMGNICRSPTAEGVLRHLVREAGLEDQVHIDSAGTLDYHVGSPPDGRSQKHALKRGYDLSNQRARQVSPRDFEKFDLVLAMDWQNLEELRELCPAQHLHKLKRLMEFAPPGISDVVADPYCGGHDGFESVLDHIEVACSGLLIHIQAALQRG
ncbi:low molecular weight protein-tyrosine-phosphatase [Ramlibacter sp. WS9]|uniref:low molecular weight protein-tyrosine-phosphatase n=1 Tax=Ramlibacter sp. WS9 TaxID=1882741 RepID=UPI001141D2C8|nr:low molecular weight protein-tyrosine-phosphatase [Ramlibacter sp. WS9]ROZ72366.1 low molecular weight phosphotyrosine protein phosphatase [Ramlibacter sp. WS9]